VAGYSYYFGGPYNNKTALIEGYLSIPFSSYFFSQWDFGFMSVPTQFGDYYCDSGAVMFFNFDLGFNFRLGKKSKPANLYFLGGVGIAFDEDLIGRYSYQEESLLLYKAAVGIDFPISNYLCMTVEYGLLGTEALGNSHVWKLGAAFTLPNFIPF
jgi:hypothetical protein